MPLASQVQASSSSALATPLVTKDELIEGSKMSLSAQDQAAKDRAVQQTLNRLKGIKDTPTPVTVIQPSSSLQPSFYASQPSKMSMMTPLASPSAPASSESAKDNAVAHTLQMLKGAKQTPAAEPQSMSAGISIPTPFLSGPSPQAAPVAANPITKVSSHTQQAPKNKEKEDDDDLEPVKVDKKLSAKEEEEAEFDYMNDVEARQRKLVEKQKKARLHEDDEPEDKKSVEKEFEKRTQSTGEFAEDKETKRAPEPASPSVSIAPTAASAAQSEVVKATLDKIKNRNSLQAQPAAKPAPFLEPSPQPSLDLSPAPAQSASQNDKDTAVQKTLEIIKKTQNE